MLFNPAGAGSVCNQAGFYLAGSDSLPAELVDLAMKLTVLLDKGGDHAVQVRHNSFCGIAYSSASASR
jgi:hypothetical protein